MASRPRPSLLALFDPLTISAKSPSTPTRDSFLPSPSNESGSDKENLISTTLKGSCTKSHGAGGLDGQFTKAICQKVSSGLAVDWISQKDLLESSISLEPKDDDNSNLCLVQLAHELERACKMADPEDILQRSHPREALSEISVISTNGSIRTPQSVARDKRLINLDSPSTTPKSLRKFAAGIGKNEPPTPPLSSPLASCREVRTPRNLSPEVNSSSLVHHASPGAGLNGSVHPAPSIPFLSHSPSFLSSTPASDPHPVFHDPQSSQLGSSFEIHNSTYMKKMDLSGDLLKDDLSFLERLEEDSFADFGRGNSSDRTVSSSPQTPQEVSKEETRTEQNVASPQDVHPTALGEVHPSIKLETLAREASTVFRRSSSHSGLVFGSKRNEFSVNLSSPINLEPRTPSTSPSAPGGDKREQVFAPKKSQAVIRRSNTLARSTGAAISESIRRPVDDEKGTTQQAKSGHLRPRPSSVEIKPLARSHSSTIKQKDSNTTQTGNPPDLARRASISRSSLARRPSIGRNLSPIRSKSTDCSSTRDQPQNQIRSKTPAIQNQKARRLSVSASSRLAPTPVKTNDFATTGRLGGARRVPLTANAPLFKASEATILEVQSPRPVPRACAGSTGSKTGPQRPPSVVSKTSTLGCSISGPATASLNKVSSTSVSANSRTLGRTASASVAAFTRSSFMTSSGTNVTSVSRLPMPPSKAGSRIPGPGTRKAF